MGPQAMTDIVILVVGDNPDHRELGMLALREYCYSVRIATTADGDKYDNLGDGRT